MSEGDLVVEPDKGDGTLLAFYKRAGGELSERALDALNDLVRGLADRGWMSPVDVWIAQQVDEGENEEKLRAALQELQRWRMLEITDGTFTGLLGSLSVPRTAHRASLSEDVEVFCRGGVELLTLPAMLARDASVSTSCACCGASITVELTPEGIASSEPDSVAGYQAAWNGQDPLDDVYGRSPLFCSDACLERWESEQSGLEGLPLGADLMAFLGAPMALELGEARFQIIARHH